ncbi:hypothetical protein PsorP6_009141 [Peronosclerospora sorghi]|uniref:Uncharacterized protein n=1 Tax=Peronosclerospora sorghi TaxID=230839 RepID=A0ACC0VZF8_9STRA|nr:hypothetical protein PsorP6_009141 [Peronosclerospora sorghi]
MPCRPSNTSPRDMSDSLDNTYNSRIRYLHARGQAHCSTDAKAWIYGYCQRSMLACKDCGKDCAQGSPIMAGESPWPRAARNKESTYRYIPEHIEIIVTEVFKSAVLNSTAAAKRMGSSSPPSVHVLISGGSHGVCVKVSDFGGGRTRKEANALCNYYQTPPTCQLSSQYDPISEGLERRASGLDILD